MIFFEDTTIVVTIALIIGLVVGLAIYPSVSSAVDEANHHYYAFEGTPNIGEPGENGMRYGWLCYPKTPHNLHVNEELGWAVNDRGICEWR